MRSLNAKLMVQFLQFGVVGISNTILAFAVYTVLLKAFAVWYVAASGIGFAVGAVNGFLLNRRWTFKEHTGDSLTPVRWAIVQTCGLGANLALVYAFVGGLRLDELVGQACATAIVTVLTFAANRSWTFRDTPAADPARADPSRADPARADPARADPARADPSRADPSRADPARADIAG